MSKKLQLLQKIFRKKPRKMQNCKSEKPLNKRNPSEKKLLLLKKDATVTVLTPLICVIQGFETRGTEISRRLTAWENLLDSVSHVGPLTTNPIEAKGMMLSRSKRSANDSSKRTRRKVYEVSTRSFANFNSFHDRELP